MLQGRIVAVPAKPVEPNQSREAKVEWGNQRRCDDHDDHVGRECGIEQNAKRNPASHKYGDGDRIADKHGSIVKAGLIQKVGAAMRACRVHLRKLPTEWRMCEDFALVATGAFTLQQGLGRAFLRHSFCLFGTT